MILNKNRKSIKKNNFIFRFSFIFSIKNFQLLASLQIITQKKDYSPFNKKKKFIFYPFLLKINILIFELEKKNRTLFIYDGNCQQKKLCFKIKKKKKFFGIDLKKP